VRPTTQLSATPTVSKLALHRETVMALVGSRADQARGVPAVKTKQQTCPWTCALTCYTCGAKLCTDHCPW
jgi:hypothetical protein